MNKNCKTPIDHPFAPKSQIKMHKTLKLIFAQFTKNRNLFSEKFNHV